MEGFFLILIPLRIKKKRGGRVIPMQIYIKRVVVRIELFSEVHITRRDHAKKPVASDSTAIRLIKGKQPE